MNIADFHFIRPYGLLALLPYAASLFWLLRKKRRLGHWREVCDAELLPYLLQQKPTPHSRSLLLPGALAALLAIVALAGPSWQRAPAPAFRNVSALVIALNLSPSMNADDIKPSRLSRARYKIADMLRQRKDGQTALLVYTDDAFTVTPLTDDIETIVNQLPALTTDIMPDSGNHAAAALTKAAELFKQAGLQKGQIMLVADAVDDSAFSAAETLGAIRLSVLGVGTADGAPIPLPGGGFVKDANGAIVIPKLAADNLAKLAQAGRGSYRTLTANDADLKALLSETDRAEAEPGKENNDLMLELWQDQGPWLLLPVLPLAALLFRKGLLVVALLLMLPLPDTSYAYDWQDLWQTRNQRAQRAFQQQQYPQAAELFDDPKWQAAARYKAGQYREALGYPPETSDDFYNQGNALAQSGQLQPALKAYEQALSLNPDNNDARYNKELVEKELAQQQKQSQPQNQPQTGKNQDAQPGNADNNANTPDGKPEQKPEHSEKPEISDAQQQQSDTQQQQAEPQPRQSDKSAEQPQPESAASKTAEAAEMNEQQQANEQWLKRIPDDPGGLLRRKFKYQYGQRQRP